jgi:hypothetical protein
VVELIDLLCEEGEEAGLYVADRLEIGALFEVQLM